MDIFACGIILFELLFHFKTYSERFLKLTMLRSLLQENFQCNSAKSKEDEFLNLFCDKNENFAYVNNMRNAILGMCSLDPAARPSAKDLLGSSYEEYLGTKSMNETYIQQNFNI